MRFIDRIRNHFKPKRPKTPEEVHDDVRVVLNKLKDRELYFHEIESYANVITTGLTFEESVLFGKCIHYLHFNRLQV